MSRRHPPFRERKRFILKDGEPVRRIARFIAGQGGLDAGRPRRNRSVSVSLPHGQTQPSEPSVRCLPRIAKWRASGIQLDRCEVRRCGRVYVVKLAAGGVAG